MFSVGITTGWYVMAPVTIKFFVERSNHIFCLEQADGVCRPWQFVLHGFSHLIGTMVLPTFVCTILILYMTLDASLSFKDVAIGLLFTWMSSAVVISYMTFISCAAPEYVFYLMQLAMVFSHAFLGFIVPRSGLPVGIRWITFTNPLYWAYAGCCQAVLANKRLPCESSSPLSCASRDFNVLINQFALDDVNQYAALLFLSATIVCFLLLAMAALHLDDIKEQATLVRTILWSKCK